ncbi:hypothetical protein Tco_0175477 [Tanacetum coccineum]
MLVDESLEMIVDESLDMIMDESLMVEDKSLVKLVDEILKHDEDTLNLTKELESSKKPSTTKETPKGTAPLKGSKTGKSASAKELVKEPIAGVVMDDVGEDGVCDDDQPQDTSKPKTAKTPNQEWFKQPPRPPTPDPE